MELGELKTIKEETTMLWGMILHIPEKAGADEAATIVYLAPAILLPADGFNAYLFSFVCHFSFPLQTIKVHSVSKKSLTFLHASKTPHFL